MSDIQCFAAGLATLRKESAHQLRTLELSQFSKGGLMSLAREDAWKIFHDYICVAIASGITPAVIKRETGFGVPTISKWLDGDRGNLSQVSMSHIIAHLQDLVPHA
jgi:hypothetical protein